MGFSWVHDFVAGKLDWLAAGLPTEGTNAQRPRAADVARRDVPTCSIDEHLGDVQKRVREGGWTACVVLDDNRVVLGLLREMELAGDADSVIDHVMRPGPSTFRPFVAIEAMASVMVEHNLPNCPITTSDGRLVGLLIREDAVHAAHHHHGHAQ